MSPKIAKLPCTNDSIHDTSPLSEFRSLKMHQTVMDKMSNTPLTDINSGIFKVHVKNFGPIESAEIDLKPLTVFVGKSNTGKTYLATLIYALHEELGGFPRLPYFPNSNILLLRNWENQSEDFQESLTNFRNKFTGTSQNPNFSDLPAILNSILFSSSTQKERIKKKLIGSILTTFGEKEIYSLCRKNGKLNKLAIKFGYSEKSNNIWHAEINVTKSNTSFKASLLHDIPIPSTTTARIKNIFEQQKINIELQYPLYRSIGRIMELLSYPKSGTPNYVHYLPAVRGGIMQSHRFVASAGLDRLLYAGLEDTRVIPRLPKTSVDFIKNLLSIGNDAPGFHHARKGRKESLQSGMHTVANKFEELVLGGHVESHTEFAEGYPEIYFKPKKGNNQFTLSQSSSMVSELAPIVLFIRHFVRQHDLLILEEPEAHLHPGAQVEIAQCVAMLIRNGVNVIVTTHSDWFLRCIQRLIIRGKLKELDSNNCNDELNAYLLESEVGVWNFSDGALNRGTKVGRIEFQEDVGIEPEEFEDLALTLYNDVVRDRNHIASIKFNTERKFVPRDIADHFSVSVGRIRRKLKQFDIRPVKGGRYFFDRNEYDKLCDRLNDEFNSKTM